MVRALVAAVVLALSVPAVAFGSDGILLLTHSGSAAWNAEMAGLAAKVNQQKPTELALGPGNRSTIEPAVERLRKRGVTAVTLVPLFAPAIAPEQVSGLPVRISAGVPDTAPLVEIIQSLIEEATATPAPAVVLLGHSDNEGGTAWKVDLSAAGQGLNRTRRFGTIITVARPDPTSELEQAQVRRSLERGAASRRIVVVSLVAPVDGMIDRWMQGLTYDLSRNSVVSDDRVAALILSLATPGQ